MTLWNVELFSVTDAKSYTHLNFHLYSIRSWYYENPFDWQILTQRRL